MSVRQELSLQTCNQWRPVPLGPGKQTARTLAMVQAVMRSWDND